METGGGKTCNPTMISRSAPTTTNGKAAHATARQATDAQHMEPGNCRGDITSQITAPH